MKKTDPSETASPQSKGIDEGKEKPQGDVSIDVGNITTGQGDVKIAGRDIVTIIQKAPEVETPPHPHMVTEELPQIFVGRQALLEDLLSALKLETPQDQMLILALFGMGGIGKTSLAAALAHHQKVTTALPDGTLWASLGPKPDVMTWLAAWIKQLDRSFDLASYPTLETRSRALASLLDEKKMLLVVDDVWRASNARWFLVGGPACRAVVTTRLSEVSQSLSRGNGCPVGVLSDSAPMDLLKGLAPQAVHEEQAAARELADLLGGHPLALTLAGRLLQKYWKTGFSAKKVLADLQNNAKRLALIDDREKPGLPEEHSLGALIGLSYDQLAEERERRGFRLLSVFGGAPNSFDLKAAVAIWKVNLDSAMSILTSLVSQAMVQTYGKGRFVMHSLLADFALSQVGAEELQAGSANHSLYFYESAKKYRPDNLKKWDEFDIEWNNIRLGANWALKWVYRKKVDQADLSRAVDYVRALDFLIRQRRPGEGKRWLAAGAEAARKIGDLGQAGWFLLDQGLLELNQGHPDPATRSFQQSAELFEKVGVQDGLLSARGNLGIVDHVHDRYESALKSYRYVTQVLEDLKDDEGVIIGYYNIGSVCFQMGDIPEAILYLQKCIQKCVKPETKVFCALATSRLAECYLEQGLLEQAAQQAELGFEHASETKLDDLIGYAYQVRGAVRAALKQVPEAQSDFTQSVNLLEKADYPEELAGARLAYAKFLVQTGKFREASRQLKQAARIFKGLGAERREAICLQWLEQASV